MPRTSVIIPEKFTTFGELLRFLRRKADLTQRELAIAVGYSESQISRLEKNERAPDEATLAARFAPALYIEEEPQWVDRLLELGNATHPHASEADALQTIAEAKPTPHNLPIQLTSFIGRENEIAEIKGHISRARLVTLTGPGGCGKTRLALQAAAELLTDFPDGVFFVNLAPITDPLLVIPTIAQTLGVTVTSNRTPLETLQAELSLKNVLLVLDNYERVLDAAPWLTILLSAAPNLKLLVTSRILLHLSGEREFLVPPLRVPNLELTLVDELEKNEAVALFVQRASSVRNDFELTQSNASIVAEICVRLDGLPLAIELAAARIKVLAPKEVLARLSSRLGLLTRGARDLPARQQTLRNTIDWSYELLKPRDQKLFARLGVFVGGWKVDAAEKVCNSEGDIADSMLDALQTLMDHNLIQQSMINEMAVRFTMLETLREYALEKLQENGDLETLRQHHANYYLQLVDVAMPINVWHDPTLESFDRMQEEKGNLRAALAWSQSGAGTAQMGLRLSEASGNFSNLMEERIWLERVLAHAEAEGGFDPHTRGRVLNRLGLLQAYLGDYAGSESSFLASLEVFKELRDQDWTISMLERFGWAAREKGDLASARTRLEQALELARELKNDTFTFTVSRTLAETMTMQGDTDGARRLLESILPSERLRGDPWDLGWTLNHLGHIAQIEGDYEEARHLHEESLALFRVNTGRWAIIEALHCLGETALAQGDRMIATTHFSESLALALSQEWGYRAAVAWCLAGFAGVAVLDEEPERAAFLWGAAEALRQSIGARAAPASHATHARLQAEVRKQLGEDVFNVKWAEGQVVSLQQAVTEALSAT